MLHWEPWSALIQVMTWCLYGTKPLPEAETMSIKAKSCHFIIYRIVMFHCTSIYHINSWFILAWRSHDICLEKSLNLVLAWKNGIFATKSHGKYQFEEVGYVSHMITMCPLTTIFK